MGTPNITRRFLSMLPTTSISEQQPAPDATAVLNLDFAKPFVPQVQSYLEALGNSARGNTRVALVGQGVAAILMLPALEMLGGLPQVALVPFGSKSVADWVSTADFRHNVVRSRRGELTHGQAFEGFTVLDGSGRGVTPLQLTELATILGVGEELIRVINVQAGNKGQVDLTSAEKATAGMADLLIQSSLTVQDWTSGRVLFLPGGAGIVGALQAISIHGISEAWPRTIRLNKGSDNEFHVEEIVDVQSMRQWAVGLAAKLESEKPIVALSGNIPEGFRAALELLANEHGVTIRG